MKDVIAEDLQLLFGDCLERMKEIPDGSVDAIICDPPYGTTACKLDSVIPFEPMWAELKRIIKPNGVAAYHDFLQKQINYQYQHIHNRWQYSYTNDSFPNLPTASRAR